MRRFHLKRTQDPIGISGCGKVCEGILFSNGKVCLCWVNHPSSIVVHENIENVLAIHCYGGFTELVYDD